MPAADDMRPPNDVRRHVSLGMVALIKQGNHPVKVDRIAGPAFALVRCEIPLASSDDLLLVLFDDLLYGLVIGVALRAKPTKKAPLNREHLDVMDSVSVPRPRRRTGRKCKVLVPWNVWGDVGAEGNREVTPSPRYFSLTTSRQGRPRFCMNSRSTAEHLSRKTSEIDTILMQPPVGNEARLATGLATCGRYSTLAHPVARRG